jgi:DNA-binding response OmpR family regulator
MAKILVIDDSVSVLAQLQHTLSDADHEVFTANCGEAGLEILQGEPVNLLITDIYLPGVNGVEVIRSVRKLRPEVGVIAMSTGADSNHYQLRAVTRIAGASLTLKKPFSMAALLLAVDAVLDPASRRRCEGELFQSPCLQNNTTTTNK